MKKPQRRKIRKVWAIKPQSRVRLSTRRQVMEKIRKRESRKDPEG